MLDSFFVRSMFLALLVVTCGIVPLIAAAPALPPAADRKVEFVRDVQPLLAAHCGKCHGATKQESGLRLDQRALAVRGGDSGEGAVIVGNSADSLLIRAIAGVKEDLVMPPAGPRLSAEQIGVLRAWIDQGVVWPESADVGVDTQRTHWSFQPVVKPDPPAVANPAWAQGAIDRFVLARLDREKLAASVQADRATLLRRVKFDLLGLPPTPEEVGELVRDESPDGYERLVDRLLASPHLGERWARHWLDVVRFAESDGFETNQPRPNAWPYRDFVIRAFNADQPYDRFVFDQLAGDTVGEDSATGFIVGGPYDRVKSPDIGLTLQQRADEMHDMVSTTGSAFLGLTVGCARCHNHKFDPISQRDYYAMKACFAGVQHGERPLRPVEDESRKRRVAELERQLAAIDQQLSQFELLAFPQQTLLLDDSATNIDPANLAASAAPSVTQIVPRIGLEPHKPGTARGQTDDPGDFARLPNLGKNYSYWKDVAGRDVFAWNPHTTGRFRVWLSWGCGWHTHAPDARYVLDRDGDLATHDDQMEIARVDQRTFADGTNGPFGQPLWSGFRNAGVHEFSPATRVILRGGKTDAYVSADLLLLQADGRTPHAPRAESRHSERDGYDVPHLRSAVTRRANAERFAPVAARFVRMTITATIGSSEPCIDEFEVFSAAAETQPRNVALASAGAKATASGTLPGFDIHKLEHVNDGRYGNSRSWISNTAGQGWVQIELPETTTIDRVVWSRDRDEPGKFEDRVATKYVIEVAAEPDQWRVVASSDDRLPLSIKAGPVRTVAGLNADEVARYQSLAAERQAIQRQLPEVSQMPMAYAGRMTSPEETFRLQRGDPLQKREPVPPAALASFGASWQLPANSPEQERRVAVARWITDPRHPLTARVIVNRLWHYHFGQGLVATPSDLGLNGARPTHPELLDWLARELVGSAELGMRNSEQDGPLSQNASHSALRTPRWSLKEIHRHIVTSATYRQTSGANPAGMTADAGTRLVWRFPPRRLEAEVLRDTILATSGQLDSRMGGPGFDLFDPNTNYVKVYNSKQDFGPAEFRRMVYQNKPRMQLDDTFGTFDCPDAGQIAPKRNSSNTPLQALNLLNSRFILQQSGFFAARLEREAGQGPAAQSRFAFRLAFGRDASPDEVIAASQIIADHGLLILCRTLLNANEFLYVF